MSGIFGLTCPDRGKLEQGLHALEVWNRFYGREGTGTHVVGRSALGCHLEHFTDRYPAGHPVQRTKLGWAVVDAVLYNRAELARELALADQEGTSDEDLLLAWIEHRGLDALAQVNGDFAGAIYHEEHDEWVLFRDHLGVRPLFLYRWEGYFACSTDLRGLAALPGANLTLDEERLYRRMMGYNTLSLRETEFSHISCLCPGSWARVAGGKLEEHIYWRPGGKHIRMPRDEDYIKELRRLVEDAVKVRVEAVSGPVGAELSGGLDSGVVDILINRLGREGKYVSWSYKPEEIPLQEVDERKVIADICRQEGITCHYYRDLDENRDPNAIFDQILPPYVNTLNISHTAAYLREQGVRVVFTGHGGDEGASHRCNLLELWYHKEYLPYFKVLWDSTRGKKLRLLRTLKRAWHQVRVVNPTYLKDYDNVERNARPLMNPAFRARMEGVGSEPLYFAYDPARYVEQGGTRVRLDNVALQGAQQGMRYLLPLVDFRVMDFALSIPRHLYLRGGQNRWIYREAFRDLLPPSLYEMQYKDAASLRGFWPDMDIRASYLAARKSALDHLDRDFWEQYLNFAAIDATDLGENFTRSEYTGKVYALSELNQCAMLQRVFRDARTWAEQQK